MNSNNHHQYSHRWRSHVEHGSSFTKHLRRVEDVEYWRQRAGWFDDDSAMKEYNYGLYETQYGREGSGGSSEGGSSGMKGSHQAAMIKNALKILSIIVALGLSILMFRAIMRRLTTDSSSTSSSASKKEKKRSESKSRSGSVKRSRSRSRSRKGDYDLMNDDEKSRKSTRSKSSSRRSRSRSRHGRSRSKGRSTTAEQLNNPEPAVKETVLV